MDFSLLHNPATLVLILCFSIPIVAIVAHYWYQTIKVRQETDLKRTMVEQGMSAEEIERVLAARAPEKRRSCCGPRGREASKTA